MFPRTVEAAFARFRANGDARALAIVFDRTAPELLGLARHLALDEALAEDLVQATFLTAMQSAKDHEPGRPVLPWLCGVLANHARALRRSRKRRPDPARLRAGAGADRVRDVHGEVDERELRERVEAAIAQLPEVYRPVMRLWLEHGLEAQEIARTLERPAGTVRAQVSRGLEQLRRALPAGIAGAGAVVLGAGRGLAAVRREVLAASDGAAVGWTATLTLTGLLMLHHKMTVLGVAAAAALLTWFAWPTPPIDAPPAPEDGGRVVAASGELGDAGVAPSARPVERAQAPTAAEPAEPAAPPARGARVLVRVRELGSDQPLRGIGVALQRDATLTDLGDLPTFSSSDARGEVAFDDLTGGTLWVRVDRIGLVAKVAAVEGEQTEQVVRLQPAGTIAGLVEDAHGNPVPGATIHGVGESVRPHAMARTDRAGRFTLTHAPRLVLQARHPSFTPSLGHPVQCGPGGRVELTLKLGPGDRRIRGTVTDHRGEPIQRAAVAVLPGEARQLHPWDQSTARPRALWLETDQQGRFSTDEVTAGEYVVCAVPRDRSQPPSHAVADTTVGDAFVELRGEPPTRVHGVITAEPSVTTPVQVLAFPEQPIAELGHLVNVIGMRTTLVNGDGTFELVGVMPGQVVLRATRGMETLAEQRTALGVGETFEWSPPTGAATTLVVHVDATGELPANTMALVHIDEKGSTPLIQPIGRDGKAELQVRASGPVSVTLLTHRGRDFIHLARCTGVAPSGEVRIELAATELPIGRVRGRLVGDALAPRSGVTVNMQRADRSGLMVMLETTTAADGTFSLGPVPAGDYAVFTGPLEARVLIGRATVSAAGDEHLGDLNPPR